jgi:lipopolysaccharide export system protein LptA
MYPLLRPSWGAPGVFFVWFLIIGMVFGGQPARGQDREDSTEADTLREEPFEAPAPTLPDSARATDPAPPDTSEPERAVVTADSLSALTREGARLQELFDNVRVRQDTTRLQSTYALRYLDRDELLFTGDVVIYERGDTLRADTVQYNKRTKVGRARSNVRLTDGEVVVRAPRAVYYTEEKRSVFPDSVTLVDSNRVLRAQSGSYWSDARRAEFQGEVRLTDPETHLEADSLTYYRDRERSIAKGEVFIRRMGEDEGAPEDTTARTYLFGDWADNQEQNRYSRVEGQALLVRVRTDSTGAPEDTLVVRGDKLEATRTDAYRRLIAVDSVRIWQSDLAAVADSAVYDRVIEVGARDTVRSPSPLPDSTGPALPDPTPSDSLVAENTPTPSPADSVVRDSTAEEAPLPDSVRTDSTRRPAALPDSVRTKDAEGQEPIASDSGATTRSPPERGAKRVSWGLPTARNEEALPLEETRLFRSPVTWFERSQVWGDSIRVRARERSLDTVYVRGSAFAAQRDSVIDRIQQLKGQDITAYFRDDSLRRIVARPNARAIRFLKTDAGTLKGAAQASGDRIVLRFREGAVKRTSIQGGVESTYYRSQETIPDPFELEGFQWTPDRKPTKRDLLRERRVRERLDIHPSSQRRPVAQRPTERVPSDSVASATGQQPDSTSAPPDSVHLKRSLRSSPPSDTSTTSRSNP